MKKATLTTILLILLAYISGFAQNEKKEIFINETSTLSIENKISVNQDFKINFEALKSIEYTKVSIIVKHKTFKSTSRRSKVKNIINFLNSSDNKQGSSIALC